MLLCGIFREVRRRGVNFSVSFLLSCLWLVLLVCLNCFCCYWLGVLFLVYCWCCYIKICCYCLFFWIKMCLRVLITYFLNYLCCFNNITARRLVLNLILMWFCVNFWVFWCVLWVVFGFVWLMKDVGVFYIYLYWAYDKKVINRCEVRWVVFRVTLDLVILWVDWEIMFVCLEFIEEILLVWMECNEVVVYWVMLCVIFRRGVKTRRSN